MSKDLLLAIQSRDEANRAKKEFATIAARLKTLAEAMESWTLDRPEYTGWFALFGDDPGTPAGYKFLCFFNPDVCEEGDEPEWTLALPLESQKTIKEFTGW
jgi:hypothetical protein